MTDEQVCEELASAMLAYFQARRAKLAARTGMAADLLAAMDAERKAADRCILAAALVGHRLEWGE